MEIGNDLEAIRKVLPRPPPEEYKPALAKRHSDAAKELRKELEEAIRELRRRGAHQRAIAKVVGCSESFVRKCR